MAITSLLERLLFSKHAHAKQEATNYDLALSGAGEGLFIRDIKTGSLWFSPQWPTTLGLGDEPPPKSFAEFKGLIHPPDQKEFETSLADHLAGDKNYYECKYRVVAPGGELHWILARGSAIRDGNGEPIAIAGSHSSFSRYEQFYMDILDAVPQLIFSKDAEGKFNFVNKALADFLGRPEEKIIGTTDRDYRHTEEQIRRFLRDDQRALAGERVVRDKEKAKDCDGEEHWLTTIKLPLVRPDGTTNVLGIATKINRLVRTEDRLEHERHLLRQLMENIPDAIYFKDAHSKFTFINQALAESLGLDKPDDAKGKSDHDFFPPDYAAQAVAEEKEILKTGTPLRNKLALTRSPTGVRWRLTTKAPIMSTAGDDPVGIVGISRDITELRRAEEEAQKQTQIARRNAVWQDASNSIAHKLGNKIFQIESHLANLRNRLSKSSDEPLPKEILNIFQIIEKGKRDIEDFKSLDKAREINKSVCPILPIVRDAARIAEQKSVIVDLPQEDFEIPADAQKLADCFDELFENSLRWFDKVPWTVKITAELVEHPRIPSVLDPKSPYLRLRYHDNGPGIQNSEKDRIFSPYVKRTKKGLGLGLALTQECITAHGGFIEETGKLGEGARFDIYLPATTKPTNTRQHEYSSIS